MKDIEDMIDKLWREGSSSSIVQRPSIEEMWFKGGARAMAKELSCEETKVVDLSVVAGSNIPMLFKMGSSDSCRWIPGFLKRSGPLGYRREKYDSQGNPIDDTHFGFCKFDTTRPVAWFGDEYPLPIGVEATIWLRDGSEFCNRTDAHCFGWEYRRAGREYDADDVIAFQVTGLAPGYKYPWE